MGKELIKPYEKTPEKLEDELRDVLERVLYDDFEIKLVSRSLI